jgi:sigma-B regulation protein RsbU (phosphoserine phosphatase)
MSAPEPLMADPERAGRPPRRRLLLVESEPDQAIYWGAVLSSLGFEVLTASSLSAATAMLADEPSIVACSSWLCDGHGIDFLAQLRGREELALVYLVLLTSTVGQEEVIASLRGGANDCIDMSASYGEVRARLELAERVISLNEALHHKSAALSDALTVIQTELQSAARLQAAMLPKALHNQNFQIQTLYRPSDLLGGDMLGVMALDADRIAFGLIDVAGHGTASALISCSLIREMMDRMLALLQDTAAEVSQDCGKVVIEEMNRRYCRLDIPGMYFTALAGVLDTWHGTVSYCQAGHPNLICFDPGEGWAELQDSGFPVGLFADAEYAIKRIQLRAGQTLLAVSDGFLRPLPGDPGGSAELLRALPRSPESTEEIIEQLSVLAAQIHGCERDDQSAMVIRCLT